MSNSMITSMGDGCVSVAGYGSTTFRVYDGKKPDVPVDPDSLEGRRVVDSADVVLALVKDHMDDLRRLGDAAGEGHAQPEPGHVCVKSEHTTPIVEMRVKREAHLHYAPDNPRNLDETWYWGTGVSALDNAGVVALEVAGRHIRHGHTVGEPWLGEFSVNGDWLIPEQPRPQLPPTAPETDPAEPEAE